MNFLKLTSVHKSSKYPEFYPDICYTGNNESFKELYQQNSNVKLLSVDIFDYDFRAAQDPQFISICSESFLFLTNDSNFDLDFLKDNFTIIPCNRKTEKLLNIEHPRIRNIENDIENNLNLFIRNFEAFQLCANSIYTFYIQRHYYSDDYFSHPQDFYSFFEERIEATIFHPNYERNISNSERNTSDDFSSLYSDLIGYYNKPEIEYELIKFDRKDFIFLKKLNEGGFASVNLCFHRPSGLIFAVKNFFGSNKSSVKQYKRELKFFTSHRHPFIVRCFGFIDGEESLVLEFLSNGDLNHYMESNSDDNYTLRLSPTQKTIILIRTLYAIDFLHSRGFIHRDIKGENIVIDRNGNSLLIDMNIVISYLDKIYYSNYDTKYSSPEMKNTIEYSFQKDIYSFGLLIFELGTFNLSSIQENETKSLLESDFGDIYKIYDFCTQEISNKNFFFRINSTAVLWNIKSDQSYFKGSDYEFVNKCFKEYDELITKNEHLSIEWYQRPDIYLLLA
ncbi:hypothetical protein TRFO_34250 [Tritrichomonas foetus]|uniref:mitogen-activated protein kinase kinase n=1 Tax=Tritrichomonas foetus TaxID=1144522 RepID=A0A1J4JP94_9EUKA|nr:hypothetical protein TRFO_34250 [Tritrichomonas foetus]|eukprot:OHS99341.1 hypothetical protein TRFO_34250 [Tritrichomonas foetus]